MPVGESGVSVVGKWIGFPAEVQSGDKCFSRYDHCCESELPHDVFLHFQRIYEGPTHSVLGFFHEQLIVPVHTSRTRGIDFWSDFLVAVQTVGTAGDRMKTFTHDVVIDATQHRWILRRNCMEKDAREHQEGH